MAITSSIGYGGDVEEDDVPTWRLAFPGTYGVVSINDWAVVLKTGVDRTVGIAAGLGYGHGVIDTNVGEVTVQLTTLASGTRYDMIVGRRDSAGTGGTTTFTKVTGTSSQTATFASRNQTPGTLDDQPLALVKVTGNGAGGVISEITDLRVWATTGGAVANSDLVLQYLNAPGTRVTIGSADWVRTVDTSGTVAWRNAAAALGETVYSQAITATAHSANASLAAPSVAVATAAYDRVVEYSAIVNANGVTAGSSWQAVVSKSGLVLASAVILKTARLPFASTVSVGGSATISGTFDLPAGQTCWPRLWAEEMTAGTLNVSSGSFEYRIRPAV